MDFITLTIDELCFIPSLWISNRLCLTNLDTRSQVHSHSVCWCLQQVTNNINKGFTYRHVFNFVLVAIYFFTISSLYFMLAKRKIVRNTLELQRHIYSSLILTNTTSSKHRHTMVEYVSARPPVTYKLHILLSQTPHPTFRSTCQRHSEVRPINFQHFYNTLTSKGT